MSELENSEIKPIERILEEIKKKNKVTGIIRTGYSEIMSIKEKVFYCIPKEREYDETFLEQIIEGDYPSFNIINKWIHENPHKLIFFTDYNDKFKIPVISKQYPTNPYNLDNKIGPFSFFYMYEGEIFNIFILRE